MGKGLAVRAGMDCCKGDIIVLMDGDGQHDPRDIEALVGPIMSCQADFVNGSRFLVN